MTRKPTSSAGPRRNCSILRRSANGLTWGTWGARPACRSEHLPLPPSGTQWSRRHCIEEVGTWQPSHCVSRREDVTAALTAYLRLLPQRAFQQLQPVLAPEDLAGRQHEARRAEHAGAQRLPGELLVQRVEFGVRRSAGAELRGVKAGALGGQCDRRGIGERFLAF